MIDFFTKVYPNAISHKSTFLTKIRFYSLIRFLVRGTANLLLPIYFEVSNLFKDYRLKPKVSFSEELIISMTSFPARIKKVHLVIETILRQTYLPDRIILWLSKEQFPALDLLPKKLLALQKRGLEIQFRDDDLRSHKKYFYVAKEFPNACFIIIDDDTFYPSSMIETLYNNHKKYPGTVCFNRGYRINIKDGNIMPYVTWKLLRKASIYKMDIIPTGVGGVLYPPGTLPKEVFNKAVFMDKCKYADDLWLYVMTLLNGKKLVKTDSEDLFLPIITPGNKTLTSHNVQGGGNDEQFLAVREYYLKNAGIEIYRMILSNN